MFQRRGDPFFDQLHADVQAGIDAGNRGESRDEDVVWNDVEQRIRAVEKAQQEQNEPTRSE